MLIKKINRFLEVLLHYMVFQSLQENVLIILERRREGKQCFHLNDDYISLVDPTTNIFMLISR